MPKAHLAKYAVVLVTLTLFLAGCPERTPITPVPQFTHSPVSGTVPLSVAFKDTSSPGTGEIKSWYWDFGDGGVSTTRNAEHTYKVPGVYDVTLSITTSEGNFSVVRQGAVTVTDTESISEPDDTNLVSVEGVTIQLPEGYTQRIAFNITKGAASIPLASYGGAEAISSVFTIRHNQASPDLFVYDDDGATLGTTLSIPILNPLPLSGIPLNNAQLFVRLEDNRVIPLPGMISDEKFTTEILRLPQRADYVVARRAELNATRISLDSPAGKELDFMLYATTETEQTLTALYRGSMDDETSFRRRNFAATDVEASIRAFTAYMQQAQNALVACGMPAPTLVCQNGACTLNLFNMHTQYSPDLERATDKAYYDTFFGHLILDPAQLAAITIRNAQRIAADEDALDFTERFYPQSAFNEALLQSVYPAYSIPVITTTGNTAFGLPVPADRTASGEVKPISFIQGLLDGAALYFGRRSLDYTGRGFGDNEFGKLSLPALFPYSRHVPGYSYAGHELLAWLDGTGHVDDPLALVARSLDGMNAALEEMGALYTRPVTYAEARAALYKALDKAVQDDPTASFTSLADVYWLFLKDYAYVNGWDAVLRPSDTARAPYTFNQDRFEEESLLVETFSEAVAERALSPESNVKLANIEPMATRAIVLDLNPMTTSIEIFQNTSVLAYGYIPKLAVYRAGQSGVEFSDPPGNVRNYSLIDTDGDGRTDTIRVFGLGGVDMNADNRVVLLLANLQYEDTTSLTLKIKTFSELPVGDEGVLARFVSTYDPEYGYDVEQVINYSTPGGGVMLYLIRMDSGVWRGAHEVEETLWQHKVLVIEPFTISKSTGMLYITGGSAGEAMLTEDLEALLEPLGALAISTRTAVALLTMVPNQPLTFTDETLPLSEDKLLAYSFDKYLTSYMAGTRDAAWPAQLPMTRAAVRAMDTVQDLMANKPGRVRSIENFVVSGVAKHGWTAWLTAAVDSRVSAIVPMAADIVNMDAQMRHHFNAYGTYPLNSAAKFIYGGYSAAWSDYVNYNIFSRLDTPAGESLLKIIDPYRYRTLLTLPKLLVNSTGDQYIPPDSSQFFIDEIGGPNYLHFMANTDYSELEAADLEEDTLEAIGAFYLAQVNGVGMPTMTATYDPETTQITVVPDQEPQSVTLWYASAPQHRDFRLQTLGPKWASRTIAPLPDGSYTATIGVPASGWNAGFMELRMTGPVSDIDHILTTRVWITPEEYGETP